MKTALMIIALQMTHLITLLAQTNCISDIEALKIENCNDAGTKPDWTDDHFAVRVTVYLNYSPGGNLELDGPFMAAPLSLTVPVSSSPGTVVFDYVKMAAQTAVNIAEIPIEVTATFTDDPNNCSFTNNDAGIWTDGQGGPVIKSYANKICSVCVGPSGHNGNLTYPTNTTCWPPLNPASDCDDSYNYGPHPDFPDHTPLKYIKVVLHVFQTTVAGDPRNFTSADIPVLKDWFDHPNGVNGLLQNMCDDPDDGPAWNEDARIRFVWNGVENEDIFFYQNNNAWGTGWSGCPSNLADPVGLAQANINAIPAYHILLTGGAWEDGNGNNFPDNGDCFYRCKTGWTSDMLACTQSGNPVSVSSGAYYRETGTGDEDCAVAAGPGIQGRGIILGEFLHLSTVDHISPFQAHVAHPQFADSCEDSPLWSQLNLMNCDPPEPGIGTRCALTRCQLGRMHWALTHRPVLQNIQIYPTDNNGNFSVTERNCYLTDPDIVIPEGADLIWNSPRQIRSNVIIEPGGRLTISCDVGLPEDARITVKRKGQLIIDGARLYSNCDGKYWEGIVVEGQNDLPQQYDIYDQTYHQGYLDIRKGSIIDRAKTAVSCQPLYGNLQTGGIVKANEATFSNCQNRFVHIRDFQNTDINTGLPIGSTCAFIRCNFIIDDGYSGDFTAGFQDMVRLKNVDGIRFSGCTFSNGIAAGITPYADDRKFGIYAVNAGFKVTGACNSNTYPCSDYTNSSFYGFNRAIYSSIHGSARPFSVSYSDFRNNLIGIDATSVLNAYIVTNNFYVGSEVAPNQPLSGSAANRGIMLSNCTGYKIENNRLYKMDANGTTNPVGILINSSGQMPNVVYRNFLSELNTGNLSNGKNRHADPTVKQGLQYLCNINAGNTGNDFAIPWEKGSYDYGIRGEQGALSLAAGNTFSSSPGNLELHIHNQQNDVEYFYSNQGTQEPTDVTPLKVVTTLSSFNICPSKVPTGKEEGLLSDAEQQEFLLDMNASENTLEERTYATDMLMRNFMIDTAGINLSAVRNLLLQKGDLASRFSVVDTWLQAGQADSAQQSLSLIPSEFSLTDELLTEYNHFNTLKTIQINALQAGISEDSMVVNNQIPLAQLAEAGPYHASYQVQALLNSVNGFAYTPDVILPSDGQMGLIAPLPGTTMNSAGDAIYLDAHPNPAKSQTIFHYRLPEDTENGSIIVTDLNGRRIISWDIEGKAGSISWDIRSLKEGVYLYYLKTDKQALSTRRLVIVR